MHAVLDSADGVRLQTRHVTAAFAGGVHTVLSYPDGTQFVRGLSTAFHTCCGLVLSDSVVQHRVALHMTSASCRVVLCSASVFTWC